MDNSTRPPSHRSHRSLNQLSLNPLISTLPPTPPSPTLAPITPASYISPTTLPSTKYPSILSRSSSRTKLRSPGPGPTPTTDPSDSNPPLPKSRPGSRHHSRRGTSTESSAYDADSSWLTRTASTLAMQSMEEKGRVWLASRTSATSLSHPQQPASYEDRVVSANSAETFGAAAFKPRGDTGMAVSSRSTPASRYASRVQSRAGSRSELRMTAKSDSVSGYDGAIKDSPTQGLEDMEPDFVDLDERDGGDGGEAVDEGEMRRLVLGRVGGWVDWMVGWMDLRGGGEEDEEIGEADTGKGYVDETGSTRRVREKGSRTMDDGDAREQEEGVGVPAPGSDVGVWEDAKWLMRIAANSL